MVIDSPFLVILLGMAYYWAYHMINDLNILIPVFYLKPHDQWLCLYLLLSLVDDSISSDYKSTVFKTNNNVIGKLLPTYYHFFDPYLVIIIVIRVIDITARYSESQTLIDIQ